MPSGKIKMYSEERGFGFPKVEDDAEPVADMGDDLKF
jgi:cold shock CspA family protein